MNRTFKTIVGSLALFAIAGAAQAVTVTSGFVPHDEDLIGVRFRSFANTGADEVYLGIPNLGNLPRAQKQLSWVSGQNEVTFTFDPAADKLSAVVVNSNGTFSLEYPGLAAQLGAKGKTFSLADLNVMQITVASRDQNVPPVSPATVSFDNVEIDGNPLGNFSGPVPSFLVLCHTSNLG